MPTTDLQRMNQDEWLVDLIAADDGWRGTLSAAMVTVPYCALGRAVAIGSPHLLRGDRADLDFEEYDNEAETAYVAVREWLGISVKCTDAIWEKSDGGTPFAEIACWFKDQRDAHNGDLTDWRPL